MKNIRNEAGEFNYVYLILLILALAGGYAGWKFGPGVVQWVQMRSIANKCAAQMNVKRRQDVRDTIRPLAADIGVPLNDQHFTMDEDEGGRIKLCTITWRYEGHHLWGASFQQEYSVSGESALAKQ